MFSMSLESLKSLFEWGGIALLAFTVFFGAGALLVNSRLGHIQEDKIREFDKELTSAKTELGKQQERAANADAKVAGLQTDAASAKTEMAKQQARAATAEQSLLELQEHLKPRRLTDKQSAAFVAILGTLPNAGIKFGHTWAGGDEAFNLLQQLLGLFKKANWKVPAQSSEMSNHLDLQLVGIGLLVPGPEGYDPRIPAPPIAVHLSPTEATLKAAFEAIHIDLQFLNWYPNKNGALELVVGSKPNP
jgi:hypothetical protein